MSHREVRVDRERAKGRRCNRSPEDRNARGEEHILRRKRVNGIGARRIISEAACASIAGAAGRSKFTNGRNIVKHSETATQDPVPAFERRPCEPRSRREIELAGGINGPDLETRCGQKIIQTALHIRRPLVGVANPKIDGERLCELDGVVRPSVVRVVAVDAFGIATNDDSAAGIGGLSRQEIGQRFEGSRNGAIACPRPPSAVETERAARIAEIGHVDICVTVFAAKLPLTTSVSPGQIVGQMSHHVGAPQRLRCAGIVESGDLDGWRSGVNRSRKETQSRTAVPHVAVVERLEKVVFSGRDLVHQSGRPDVVFHCGKVMNVHRRFLEIVRNIRSDGRNLGSSAAEIAQRERMFVGEALIDFRDSVETVVRVQSVCQVVIRRRGTRGDAGRKKSEQVQRDRIDLDPVLRQHGLSRRDPGGGRRGVQNREAGYRELYLAGEEEERLVLPDRPAGRKPKLVVPDFGYTGSRGLHSRRPRQVLIAVEEVESAMQIVGPRFDNHLDGAARVAACVRSGIGLDGELIDGFNGQKRAGYARDAALIDRHCIGISVVVIRAVDLKVLAIGPRPVQRSAADGRRSGR